MEIKEILKTVRPLHCYCPASTWSEIKEILDDAMNTKQHQHVSQLLL